jgi:hypothetical protein
VPDISMCTGGQLPECQNCYRRKATPSMWQSYFGTPPDGPNGCDYYWAPRGEAPRNKDEHDVT